MISFDFLMTNLVITAAILTLSIFYVVILLKMKPSTEKEDHHKKKFLAERREPLRDELIFVNSLKTEEKTALPKRAQTQTNTEKIPLSSTKTPSISAQIDRNQEAPKQVVELANQPSTQRCVHHFGYLRELPKNTQIPSECLGCPQIVECMITSIVEKKRVESHVA